MQSVKAFLVARVQDDSVILHIVSHSWQVIITSKKDCVVYKTVVWYTQLTHQFLNQMHAWFFLKIVLPKTICLHVCVSVCLPTHVSKQTF